MPEENAPRRTRADGRRVRSERTKQGIVEAYLALVRADWPILPTAAKLAERAGCSVRSIFERFPDIHSLQVAAADYAIQQVVAMAAPRDGGGDRAARIRALAPRESAAHGATSPAARARNSRL